MPLQSLSRYDSFVKRWAGMQDLKNLAAAPLPHAALAYALSARSHLREWSKLPSYLKQVEANFPELRSHSAKLITSSLANVVLILDNRWVFRFPRNDWRRANFSRELRVLARLRKRTTIRIPELACTRFE